MELHGEDEIAVGFRKVRPNSQGLAVAGDGFVEPARVLVHRAEVDKRIGVFGTRFDRPPEGIGGLIEPGQPSIGVAEIVERLRQSGIDDERAERALD